MSTSTRTPMELGVRHGRILATWETEASRYHLWLSNAGKPEGVIYRKARKGGMATLSLDNHPHIAKELVAVAPPAAIAALREAYEATQAAAKAEAEAQAAAAQRKADQAELDRLWALGYRPSAV